MRTRKVNFAKRRKSKRLSFSKSSCPKMSPTPLSDAEVINFVAVGCVSSARMYAAHIAAGPKLMPSPPPLLPPPPPPPPPPLLPPPPLPPPLRAVAKPLARQPAGRTDGWGAVRQPAQRALDRHNSTERGASAGTALSCITLHGFAQKRRREAAPPCEQLQRGTRHLLSNTSKSGHARAVR